MTNLVNFYDKKFKQYFNNFKDPQKFILYCAVINRIITYINKNEFANFESFVEQNFNKDLFLENSESEYIISNFETKFTNNDYFYVLNYVKNLIVFNKNESKIAQEINEKIQKTMSLSHYYDEKSNGGIFNEQWFKYSN